MRQLAALLLLGLTALWVSPARATDPLYWQCVAPSATNLGGGNCPVSTTYPMPTTASGGGGGGGLSVTDGAAFTGGTSSFTPGGGTYNVSIPPLTTGSQGTFALTPQRSLHVLDDNSQTIASFTGPNGGLAVQDRAAFTFGTSVFSPIGGQYAASITALTDGQSGAAALTTQRSLHTLDDNSGSALTALQAIQTNTGNSIPAGSNGIGTVGITGALPAGSNSIGAVTAAAGSHVTGFAPDIGSSATAAWTGSGTPTVLGILQGIYNSATGPAPAGTNIIGRVGIDQTTPGSTNAVVNTPASQYPSGAVAITASPSNGTTGAVVATLAHVTGHTVYICGFAARANATSAATVNLVVSGTITGSLNFLQWIAPASAGIGLAEEIFTPCVPASGINTDIVVTTGAPGTGGNDSVSAWGYSL